MNKLLRMLWLILLGWLLAGQVSYAQTALGPKDGGDLPAADLARIKIGNIAPDFTLADQDGKPLTLSGYQGKQAVILVFYRGFW